MSAILAKIRQEPAVVIALVGSILALLAGFGLELSTSQQGAVMAVVSAVLGLFTRSLVSPVATNPTEGN